MTRIKTSNRSVKLLFNHLFFVTVIEISAKKSRMLTAVLCSSTIYIGEIMLSLISMVVPYWKTLTQIIYTLSLLFIFHIFLVRESPRWQIVPKWKDERGKANDTINCKNE